MKRLLFTLLSAVALFSSCSSDNDFITQDTNLDPVKYTVKLNVKSAGFEVEKAPLKSTQANPNQASFMQVIVYNETGTVYSDTIIEQSELGIKEGITPISLKLPKGNYYLSIFNRIYNSYYSKIEDVIIIPNNYETDYYDRKLDGYHGNENIYYYTSILNVAENSNNNNKDIVLEPMWSYIQSPTLKYAPDFVSPAGSDGLYEQISPVYFGFGIKSKLARTRHTGIFKEFDYYDTGYVSSPFPVVVSKAEDSNLFLEMCYIKTNDGYSGGRILKIQKINLNTKIENGMNYTISGTIPPIDSIDTGIMHIGLEPFKDSDISFQ